VSNCFIHPNLLTLTKTSFKNVARDSAVAAKKKMVRPIRVIDFFGTNQVYIFEPARKYPIACSTAVT